MDLKGALKKLINDTSAIEGTVVKLYRSQADVRPAHSGTLMRQVWIPEDMRGEVKVGDHVRVSRTPRGLVLSDVLDTFTKKNLGLIAVRQAPGAPTHFAAAVRGTTIIFTWKSPGGKIAHYEILQALDSQGTGETIIASPAGTSYALQLPSASSYYYAVRAEDIWKQKGKKSAYLQVVISAESLNVGAEQRPSAVAFSWSEFSDVGDPEVSARYKVDIYREDDEETPVESVVLDSTSFLYSTDVAMAFSATVTALAPNGQQLGGGSSSYVEPDLAFLRGDVEITDSEDRTTETLKVLLDNSWETGVAYDAQTWHWVQFKFTPSRLLDYLALVANIPRVRALIALTYDESLWHFYGGDVDHAGRQATYLGQGALAAADGYKADYLMLQGEEGNRLACAYPKQLTRTARIYFYPEDGALSLTELIPDTRLIVGFLDALYEITTGGRMVARGEGGAAIQIGYWSGSENDYGIYATDKTGRPFFVLNVPREYLRIGYPEEGKAIIIENGDIFVDGSVLVDGTVSADAINANTLSAISANLGEITAGAIVMGEDIGNGFTGLKIVYPDEEHSGIGIYRDGTLQAILSTGGYIQFGQATMDAEGIRQPLGPGQWVAFKESGLTAWIAGEASIFDDTETLRVYNSLFWMPDETEEYIDEGDSRFQQSPTSRGQYGVLCRQRHRGGAAWRRLEWEVRHWGKEFGTAASRCPGIGLRSGRACLDERLREGAGEGQSTCPPLDGSAGLLR